MSGEFDMKGRIVCKSPSNIFPLNLHKRDVWFLDNEWAYTFISKFETQTLIKEQVRIIGRYVLIREISKLQFDDMREANLIFVITIMLAIIVLGNNALNNYKVHAILTNLTFTRDWTRI